MTENDLLLFNHQEVGKIFVHMKEFKEVSANMPLLRRALTLKINKSE